MSTRAADETAARTSEQAPGYAWYALAVLTLVYVLNFLDRQLIYILFPPIKADLRLTDLQLALLGTTSFVIFYTLLGIPFGRLADRVSRKAMIAAGLAVWSLFSGLTGFARDFNEMFFCRVMVGVGEATLGPAALSLLSDYFPPRRRATVAAIYSSGIALGGGIAYFLGGQIGAAYGWRWAFYLLGFPGLALAIVVFLLREEARGRTDARTTADAPRSPRTHKADWRVLLRTPALRYHNLGYAIFALATYSLGIWGPTFFVRVHRLDLPTIGWLAGVLSVAAGLPGTILGGVAADRLKRRYGAGGRMTFTALGALVSIPFWLALLFSSNVVVLLVANFVLLGVALMWLGPAAADVADIAGPASRGLGIGIYFFVVNIVGYGLGPPLIGRFNDLLGVATNPEAMRYSLLVSPLACLVAAALLWRGGRAMRRAAES